MNYKRNISKLLIFILSFTFLSFMPSNEVLADSFKVVTLGADLTKEQKQQMLDYFKVTKNDANILEVTKQEEDKYLGKVASKEQLGTRSISCSYVEPASKGGLQISTYNISWVTESMIKNALITAGIENAIVKAAAPFTVSGTAALTGILKGFENSSAGEKIDENKKEAANEELVVTGGLGEKIGADKAAAVINDVKKDVIKEKPETPEEIKKIVSNVAKDYDLKLADEDMEKITSLMTKINKLDLNFDSIKNQLNDVANKLKDKISGTDGQGFFEKIKNFFSDLIDSVKDFFINLFSSDNTDNKDSEDSTKPETNNANDNENKSTTNTTSDNKNSDEITKDTNNTEKKDSPNDDKVDDKNNSKDSTTTDSMNNSSNTNDNSVNKSDN